ncbi:MAG: sugar ABC transporter permease [Chloroflexi bacterium]|nr:sugar ABC transporter permease [Chloroflexota bacterium]
MVMAPGQRQSWSIRRQEAIEGYLYIAPWLLGFSVFTIFPVVFSLYLSFTSYNVLVWPPPFVGLANFEEAFFKDRLFWPSLWRTVYFALLIVPLGIIGSLGAALLLNQGYKGTTIFRTLYYLPTITPIIASALLWIWIFQPSIGVMNYLLSLVGINPGPGWLQSTVWAIPSVAIIAMWGSVGGSRMIVFLAGLQGVSKELHEASEIDGANAWQRFWNITLPMISPTMFFNLIISVIAALSVFSIAYIATGGGPAYATYFYVYYLFNNAFQFSRMGYASALAWIFLVVVLALTVLQFTASKYWVFYAGEESSERGNDGR